MKFMPVIEALVNKIEFAIYKEKMPVDFMYYNVNKNIKFAHRHTGFQAVLFAVF